jgi:hypothetical protein
MYLQDIKDVSLCCCLIYCCCCVSVCGGGGGESGVSDMYANFTVFTSPS